MKEAVVLAVLQSYYQKLIPRVPPPPDAAKTTVSPVHAVLLGAFDERTPAGMESH